MTATATKHVRTELLRLATTTSIKGLPRAVKAERPVLKVLWAVSTSVFIGFVIWQAIELVTEYLHFETVTMMKEINIDEGDNIDEMPEPDITVCNLNPFAGNYSAIVAEEGIPSLEAFKRIVINATTCEDCSRHKRDRLASLRNSLLTVYGYYAFIGEEDIRKLGHTQDNFIIDCFIHERKGYRSIKKPCPMYTRVTNFTDPYLYNCWTITTPLELRVGKIIVGVSLTLHLDNFYQDYMRYLDIEHNYHAALGALLVLHEHKTLPPLHRSVTYLRPGVLHNVKVEPSTRKRQSQPYGVCHNNSNIKLEGYEWKYTQDACASKCMEQDIIAECTCLDLFTLNILDRMYSNLSYCMDPSLGQNRMLYLTNCSDYIREKSYQHCALECQNPCQQILFNHDISQGNWPPDPYESTFYDAYIDGREYEWRYSALYDLIGSTTVDYRTAHLVSRNFLHADITMTGVNYLEFTDKPKTTTSTFLSQLGGELNLFAGITMVVLVELLDFLWRLFCPERKGPSQSPSSVNPVQPPRNIKVVDWIWEISGKGCLTHWGRDQMAAFSQTTLSNAFSWMKILEFRLKFHWTLFLRVLLTIFQHWFW